MLNGSRQQQLIRRVGKVHRHELPPLRFVHFEIEPWDEGRVEELSPVLFYVFDDPKLRQQHHKKQNHPDGEDNSYYEYIT